MWAGDQRQKLFRNLETVRGVAVQLGHTDGGALVMSTYGHPSEIAARERLKRAFGGNVRPLAPVETPLLRKDGKA